MLSVRTLAARMIEQAVSELEADLHALRYPETPPIAMDEWLAHLDARPAEAPAPFPDFPDGRTDDGFWEDFDRRR